MEEANSSVTLFVLDPEKVIEKDRVRPQRYFLEPLNFFILTTIFTIVGSRAASLVVLEFSLRAISMLLSQNKGGQNSQLFLLCQFSVGCGITSSLSYLHEGAPHSTMNLILCTGLAGLIMWYVWRLVWHICSMYELHSKQRYCGICIFLLTNWHKIPKLLCNALKVTFMVADIAAISLINRDFLSTSEAIRFWTPLTICYTLLVIYMQEEQRLNPSEQMTYQTVVVRMGGLFILTLTVGKWADVFHVCVSFLGEMWCLVKCSAMLELCREQDSYSQETRSVKSFHGKNSDLEVVRSALRMSGAQYSH
ncbi:transmembrane protein 82 [Protopterus annectens]|uniref:transmembrane protein 82 n=1 Tax=Protopterus annectens TaxID=7888 RepID=UPI001CF97AEC|nr:transmembrane protein 82 [Protopterus annectens]